MSQTNVFPNHEEANNVMQQNQIRKTTKLLLIFFNFILVAVGQVGGGLLTRIYFLHGGKRRWLGAWLLTAGFPLMIVPIAFSYTGGRARANLSRLLASKKLVIVNAFLGLVLGLESYLYTVGISYLPVSVFALLSTTQLAFIAIFAFLVIRHRFTHYSINAVVLMAMGSIVLGVHMNGDKPNGESNRKYMLGFIMTISAAALHGLLMSGVEYSNQKSKISVTFDLLMQVQLVVSIFATLFCTIPMIINGDFQAIPKEAAAFELGATKYYMVLILAAIALQFMVIGNIGLIFCSSSLFSGIVSALLVPVQQIFAVIFLPESFNVDKGVALALCLWGFASYLYGEYKIDNKKGETKHEEQQEVHAEI